MGTLGFGTFVYYSLGSILRNGKRSIYALIGIIIALSLISGSWIAVDSSGAGLLRAAVNGVPVDYVGTPNKYLNDVVSVSASTTALIESVEDIELATPIISVSSACYMNSSGGVYLNDEGQTFNGSLIFLSSGSQHIIDSFKIAGSLPNPGNVAISKDVADSLNLAVGDNLTCVFKHVTYAYEKGTVVGILNVTYLNITSSISSIWTQPGHEDLNHAGFSTQFMIEGDDNIWMGLAKNPVIFNLADYDLWGLDRSGSTSLYSVSLNYFIWVNRADVVTLANIPASIDRLDLIRTKLIMKLEPVSVMVSESLLAPSLGSLQYDIGEKAPLFLALSVPVLALGIYFSMIGVDLSLTERRREAAILKSRGASNDQVFGSLIIEAIVLGVISGVAALLLGVLVSRFMLGSIASLGGEAATEVTDFMASPETIVLSILLGISLMLLSSYGQFKRVSKTSVTSALHHYSPSATRLEYRAGGDILLLILSLWSIVAIILGSDWPGRQGFSWIVEAIATILVFSGIMILPLLPFTLSLSLVHLLTRGSRKIYSKFAWLVKPWTKDLHYLVDRNIVRNPRRASNLCVIISLALAFGLFISITMESTINYEQEKVNFEVGADINLVASATDSRDKTVNLSKLDALDSLPGVAHSVTYSKLDATFDIYSVWPHVRTAIMNFSDYFDTIKPSDFYFVGGGNEPLQESSGDNSMLLNNEVADSLGLAVGDELSVVMMSSTKYHLVRVTVVGMVKGLPGLPGVDAFIDRSTISNIPYENLTGILSSNGALIDVMDGTNPLEVAYTAARILESDNLASTSTILQERLDALSKDPAFFSFTDFLRMEYVLSIVIMAIGVGLLIFVSVHDRENELACIMARGSSGGQLRKILMGESMSLMILGLVIGTCVGILTAFLFNTLSGEVLYSAVERKMIFTLVSLSVVLSSVVALLIASLFATSRAGNIKLAEVLRIRGG
ncbi:MAG: FtsX-like permease family protein [Thermoplasmata archaeon]|nr:FtsX-like permease family protein [Thermoplasmata archaeon]